MDKLHTDETQIIITDRSVPKVIEGDYWTYITGALHDLYEPLYKEISSRVSKQTGGRYSCIVNFNPKHKSNPLYSTMSTFTLDFTDPWPILESIKTRIFDLMNINVDYCLIHLYKNGSSSIGWHSDKEALNSSVISISFGATRKFRFKPVGQKTGYTTEFHLCNGDILWMHPGCQSRYVHTVPVEKRIKMPRINLTFRQYETP